MDALDRIVVETEGAVDAAVIWLHGLGADGHDFAPTVPLLGTPGVRYLFPHAPARPVTVNGGYVMRSWYDIRHLAPGPERESLQDLRASAAQVRALVEEQVAAGIAPERIVLVGFSQGGAVASHTALRFPHRLAGLVALSTYLVRPDLLADEAHPANASTPVRVGHGTQDPVVPLSRGEVLAETLRPGRDLQLRTWPMGHAVNEEELRWVGAAIGGWLGR